jgi:glycosyltransferase involved in cell wall biosynthesis
VSVIALNCKPGLAQLMLGHAMQLARGLDVASTRRVLGRRLSRQLGAELSHKGCADVLHMSTLTVPPRNSTPGVRHHVLCDSMNSFWDRYSIDVAPKSLGVRRLNEADERAAVAAVDRFFPVSEFVADCLVEEYGVPRDRITVVGTGLGRVEPLRSEKDYSTGRLLMVAQQRFTDKGGFLLIEALRLARRSNPRLHLTLVTSPGMRRKILGAEGVTVASDLAWEQLQRLFYQAALYAMPAPCEPWGLVYLEALACKTPILALNRAAQPELAGHGRFGFLIDDASPQAVADGLLEAVSDSARLRRMGEQGQEHTLRQYSWERTARRILEVIFDSDFPGGQ